MSVIIVGAGHAGGQATAALRQLKYDGPIKLIGDEPRLPYQRPPLTKEYLRGEFDRDRLLIRPKSFYESNNITTVVNRSVAEIEEQKQIVICDDGSRHHFEKIVLATGSRPIKPAIPGVDLEGVHLLRRVGDVDGILADLDGKSTVAVIGGGYIGLEAAASLSRLGCDVIVIEMEDRLLKRVATEELSSFYCDLHTGHGIKLHLSTQVLEITGNHDGKVSGVNCSDGSQLSVDVVVIGIGIQPNTDLAERMGLRVENGIWVDEHTRTSHGNIYAAGDCTNHPNSLLDRRLRLESVPNAMEQARAAASNLIGTATEYSSYPWFWSDQFDIKLQMVGFATDRDETVSRGDKQAREFIDFHLKGGKLIGADAVNSPRMFMAARRLVGKSVNVGDLANEEIDLKQIVDA